MVIHLDGVGEEALITRSTEICHVEVLGILKSCYEVTVMVILSVLLGTSTHRIVQGGLGVWTSEMKYNYCRILHICIVETGGALTAFAIFHWRVEVSVDNLISLAPFPFETKFPRSCPALAIFQLTTSPFSAPILLFALLILLQILSRLYLDCFSIHRALTSTIFLCLSIEELSACISTEAWAKLRYYVCNRPTIHNGDSSI